MRRRSDKVRSAKRTSTCNGAADIPSFARAGAANDSSAAALAVVPMEMMDWVRRIRQRLARSPNIVGRSRTRNSWSLPIRRNKRTRGNLVPQRIFLSRRRLQKSPEQRGKVSWSKYREQHHFSQFVPQAIAYRVSRIARTKTDPQKAAFCPYVGSRNYSPFLRPKTAGVLSPGLAEREGFEPSIRL
jgi:hypothetical protein